MNTYDVIVGNECVLNSGGHRMTIIAVTNYVIELMYFDNRGIYRKVQVPREAFKALTLLEHELLVSA